MAPVPAVAVVVPCFNKAPYLRETLESVAAQTLRDLELVIVDDGSTDDSVAVAEAFLADHPGLDAQLVRQPNSGHPSHTRNAGIRAARAPMLLCLDGDDRLTPGYVEALLRALEAHPDKGFAYGDQLDFGLRTFHHVTPPYDFPRLLQANFLGNATLFRREACEAAGGFDAEATFGMEDWDFWIALGCAGWHGLKVDGVAWEYRVLDDGLFVQGAVAHDLRNRAGIVLRRPEFYDERQVAWARAARAGERWALEAAGVRGVIPSIAALPAPPVRGTVTLAHLDELVADPSPLGDYAARTARDADATLVLYAPHGEPGTVAADAQALLEAVGLDGDDAPDMLLLAEPEHVAGLTAAGAGWL